MRGDKPEKSRAEPPLPRSKWVVAVGGFALVAVLLAWAIISNPTWPLFLPLLAITFVVLFRLVHRRFPRGNGAALAMSALASLAAAAPLALALVAPADLLNRLSLDRAAPVMARVINVERKEDSYGRGTRKFHYYTLKLDAAGRDIVLRGPEERARFGSSETVSICGYRGLLGLPVYGLPPCTRKFQME